MGGEDLSVFVCKSSKNNTILSLLWITFDSLKFKYIFVQIISCSWILLRETLCSFRCLATGLILVHISNWKQAKSGCPYCFRPGSHFFQIFGALFSNSGLKLHLFQTAPRALCRYRFSKKCTMWGLSFEICSTRGRQVRRGHTELILWGLWCFRWMVREVKNTSHCLRHSHKLRLFTKVIPECVQLEKKTEKIV